LQVLLTSLAAQFKLSRFHFAKIYLALTGYAPIQDFYPTENSPCMLPA
jgi:hypothetical protein